VSYILLFLVPLLLRATADKADAVERPQSPDPVELSGPDRKCAYAKTPQ
jgi:hypothetical protein